MAKKVKYDPVYAEMLVEHCKEGKDLSTFAATIEISRATLYNWINRHEDLKLAHEWGVQHLKNRGIDIMTSFANGTQPKGANFQAAAFLCRAVYGLRDDVIPVMEEDPNKAKKKEITLNYKIDDLKPDVEVEDVDFKQLDTQEGNIDEKEGNQEEGKETAK